MPLPSDLRSSAYVPFRQNCDAKDRSHHRSRAADGRLDAVRFSGRRSVERIVIVMMRYSLRGVGQRTRAPHLAVCQAAAVRRSATRSYVHLELLGCRQIVLFRFHGRLVRHLLHRSKSRNIDCSNMQDLRHKKCVRACTTDSELRAQALGLLLAAQWQTQLRIHSHIGYQQSSDPHWRHPEHQGRLLFKQLDNKSNDGPTMQS